MRRRDCALGDVVRAPEALVSPFRRRTTLSTSVGVKAWKSGSPPRGCSSARNQTACTVVMPSSRGAAHVLVEPVADEHRLLGLDAELLERAPEDGRMRLADADLGREHEGVQALGEPHALHVAVEQPARVERVGDEAELEPARAERVEQRVRLRADDAADSHAACSAST